MLAVYFLYIKKSHLSFKIGDFLHPDLLNPLQYFEKNEKEKSPFNHHPLGIN
jgi:hypothetical protein